MKKNLLKALPVAGLILTGTLFLQANSSEIFNRNSQYKQTNNARHDLSIKIENEPTSIVYADDKTNQNVKTITPAVSPNEDNPIAKSIKLGLLLDTSNSMDGLIHQAQSQLWKIVNELANATCEGEKPKLEIALYEYGNDGLSAKEGYIRMVTPLTNDLDQISSDLFGLRTNGGSEFCGHVIQTATNQLDWGEGDADLKLMFIAGNEPFTQGSVDPNTACINAEKQGITINTIFCGDLNEGSRTGWLAGAQLTAGEYFSISHNSKTLYIDTPYDDEINNLNTSLNETYIPYGSQGETKKMRQSAEDDNAAKWGRGNSVSRTISKNSHIYDNRSWDLVDAYKQEGFAIEEIEVESLPKEMKNMSKKKQVEFIEEKTAERLAINKKIADLNTKRLAFIAEKKKEIGEDDETSLDEAMISAIKKQAKTKRFSFEYE